MYTWGDAFTSRQLATLTTLCDLVAEARTRAHKDAVKAGLTDDDRGLDANGTGARAYAEAVSVYLACAVSKTTNIGSSLASWMNDRGAFREAFARQALPMVWDFAEANTFADAGGSFDAALEKACLALEALPATTAGHASQLDAATQTATSGRFVSTDPPYYDNIGYAELSDFFYVWLRPVLRSVFPQLFATIATPKAEELIAAPYRHGGKSNAEKFFLDGMTLALRNLATQAHPAAPITIYYAFRQSETEDDLGTSSTGWETFLEALIRAGFALTGTWPMRTEGAGRLVARGTNALASSIILVCRHREKNSGTIDRRKFQRLLNETLPAALATMTRHDKGMHSPVAPVDLSQAIIGPGMAIFSRYDAVLEANGSPMTVKTALQLINRFLAGEDFDSDTQFCLHWFESHCWNAGKFGEADVLARAKGTGIDGLKDAGVLNSASGSVRLFRWDELPSEWAPETNRRISSWEVLHHLIHITNTEGERSGGAILATVQAHSEAVRALAYRLYTVCERRGWAAEASAYNNIVLAWDSLVRDARHSSDNEQDSLIGRDASRSSRQGQRLRKAK
jgi:putative DNA methylase